MSVSTDIITLTFATSDKMKNSRTMQSIIDHAKGEVQELQDEIDLVLTNQTPGSDGIEGEAIDIILCMLDLIRVVNPDMTPQQVTDYAKVKLDKWVRKYSNF